MLHLLLETERDHHYLAAGFPSLFEFTTKELGYSPASAYRRIQSMRLLKTMPELGPQIEAGTLSLCVAAKTQSFFKKEDDRRKSEGLEKLGESTRQDIAQSMVGVSTRDCERKLVAISPDAALPQEKNRPVAPGKNLIQFVVDDAVLAKFEKLKLLLAHQVTSGQYDQLFSTLADFALKKLEKSKPSPTNHSPLEAVAPLACGALPPVEVMGPAHFVADSALTDLSQSQHQSESEPQSDAIFQPQPASEPRAESRPSARSRYISADVRRAVWIRDQGQCQFLDPRSQRRCLSRFSLEVDHIQPFAKNGPNTFENLRLYCRAHNQYSAKSMGLMQSGR